GARRLSRRTTDRDEPILPPLVCGQKNTPLTFLWLKEREQQLIQNRSEVYLLHLRIVETQHS
ncbi:MAG: hypothetical protein AAB729_04510, partial [Patescibacteria group bacterium]